jgi:glycosyltransferase involved in cell wall biosynthesis
VSDQATESSSESPIRVTVGLPVRNGQRFLSAALDSIRSQTFRDFELIISDNASTDATAEICKGYAASDCRVRYYRNAQDLGAAANFNRVVALARGAYFKWAAHDDVLAPDYLEHCVAALDRDPSVVLCHSRVVIIDERGGVLNEDVRRLRHAGAADAPDRFADVILGDHGCFHVFGVMRTPILKQTAGIGPYTASDRVLLAELALRGRFADVALPLFLSRAHPDQSINAMPTRQQHAVWFDPANRGRFLVPTWQMFTELLKTVQRTPLSSRERRACHVHLLRWLGPKLNAVRMGHDLLVATRLLVSRRWGMVQ